ncbi:MAG: transglycosylase SLT domain-containing protein [Deltaproteobacteria bacterium]|nr:transglycosylase SLT domain-containing protein [Candidatus Tharpella aukensis]
MYCKKAHKIKYILFAIGMIFFQLTTPLAAPADNQPSLRAATIDQGIGFTPPETLSFCGEPLPLHEQYSREMLDREFTIAVYDRAQVVMWLKRSARYFTFFERELKAAGLPDDLKFLPVAESALIDDIRSRAGAAGLWQFMKSTGRRQNLRITTTIDERLDLFASTRSALQYLAFLKDKFTTWSLALAAYNCGEKRVSNAMSEQKSNDYYHLSLPRESERYLYRLAAIKIILKSPELYGFKLPDDQYYQPLSNKPVSLKLKNEFSLTDFALQLDTSYHTLKQLNPHLISKRLPSGNFNLLLPKGCNHKIAAILKTLKPVPRRSNYDLASYTVKNGDTLTAISHRFRIPIAKLKKINRLESSKIMIGQKLHLRH